MRCENQAAAKESRHETNQLPPPSQDTATLCSLLSHPVGGGDFCVMSEKPSRRAPAFMLYVDDFLGGTSEMSAEEVGGYIRLLCHQWAKGGLPNDLERLGRMAGLLGSPSLGYAVAKFTLCDDGQLRHPRLEALRSERDAFLIKQAESGKKGAEKRWKDRQANGNPNGEPIATPLATPMANGCPEHGSPSPSPSPDTKPPTPASASDPEPRLDLPVELPPGFPQNEAAAQFSALAVGCTEAFAVDEWHRAVSRGGRDHRDVPIRSWASYLRTCWTSNQNRTAENANRDRNSSGGRHGQPSAADIRRSLVAGAADTHRDSLITAAKERALAESDDLPI